MAFNRKAICRAGKKDHEINKKSIFQLFPSKEIHPREKNKDTTTTAKMFSFYIASFPHHSLKLILTLLYYPRTRGAHSHINFR